MALIKELTQNEAIAMRAKAIIAQATATQQRAIQELEKLVEAAGSRQDFDAALGEDAADAKAAVDAIVAQVNAACVAKVSTDKLNKVKAVE